jgi:thioredoxin 1
MLRVLKFYADWCQPCKALSKSLEEIKTDTVIENIDIDKDENRWIVSHYNIRSVPTMIMLDENVEVKRKSGSMVKSELETWING